MDKGVTKSAAPIEPVDPAADAAEIQELLGMSANDEMLGNPTDLQAQAELDAFLAGQDDGQEGEDAPEGAPEPEMEPEPSVDGLSIEELRAELAKARKIGGKAANDAAELRRQADDQPDDQAPPAAPRNMRELGQRLMSQLFDDPDQGIEGAKEWASLAGDESELLVLSPGQFERVVRNLYLTTMTGVSGVLKPVLERQAAADEAAALAQIGLDQGAKAKLMAEKPYLARLSGQELLAALKDLAPVREQAPTRAPLRPSPPIERPSAGAPSAPRRSKSLPAMHAEALARGDTKLADSLLDRILEEDNPVFAKGR